MNLIVSATILQTSLFLNLFVRYTKDSILLSKTMPILGSSIFVYHLTIILFLAMPKKYAVHEEKEICYFIGVYYDIINSKDYKK